MKNCLAGTASAHWLKGMRIERYDFSRHKYAEGMLDGTLNIDPKEPLFYARLSRP